MSANITSDGLIRQLDGRAEPDENITEQDVQDAPKLSKLLLRMLRDVAAMRRRWRPHRIDFEDIAVDDTGTTKYRLEHHLGGKVRWWVVDWQSTAGAAMFEVERHDDTDDNTLVFVSMAEGTMTVRVEEAGA